MFLLSLHFPYILHFFVTLLCIIYFLHLFLTYVFSSILFINDTFYPSFFRSFLLVFGYILRYFFILSFKSSYFYCLFSPSALCMLRTPLSLAVPHMQFCFRVSLLTQTERLTGSRCFYLQCEISTRIFIVKQ